MAHSYSTTWSDEAQSYLRMRWADGASQKLIAEEMKTHFPGQNYSRQCVSIEVKRLNLPCRYLKDRAQIITLRSEGRTNREIADAVGQSLVVIEYNVRQLIAFGLLEARGPGHMRDDDINNLGELPQRLRRLRAQGNLTQKALGEIVGRSNWTILHWEIGIIKPSKDVLPLLAQTLGVSVDMLLHGREHPIHRAIAIHKNEKV